MKTNWISPPDELNLNTNQVDIWRISMDAGKDFSAESTLSADESQRASRFRFEVDRHRFIESHVALRDILSRYLNCPPEEINFIVGEYGKPSLSSDINLDFNLSHSGDFALIAVACRHKVGVDVEHFRPDLEIEKIARRFFSEAENTELMNLPSEQRITGFFHCWTRKEAYIKAQGLGLSLALDSFDVSLTPNEPALLRATRPDAQEASGWALISLDIDALYAGAAAVNGRDLEFRFWDWNIIR